MTGEESSTFDLLLPRDAFKRDPSAILESPGVVGKLMRMSIPSTTSQCQHLKIIYDSVPCVESPRGSSGGMSRRPENSALYIASLRKCPHLACRLIELALRCHVDYHRLSFERFEVWFRKRQAIVQLKSSPHMSMPECGRALPSWKEVSTRSSVLLSYDNRGHHNRLLRKPTACRVRPRG